MDQTYIGDLPIEGCVYTEGNEIDDIMPANLNDLDDNSSSSGSDTDSELNLPSDTKGSPTTKRSKFKVRFRPARGCGAGTAWEDRKPPTVNQALEALAELDDLLKPNYKKNENQKRYKKSTKKGWSEQILKEVQSFLRMYTSERSKTHGQWTESAYQTAIKSGKDNMSDSKSRAIRKRAKEFITKRLVPQNPFGTWSHSKIDEDEELKQELNLHLQSKGLYMCAEDIKEFLNDPEIQEKYGFNRNICLATAKRWMKKLGYRWVRRYRGQYADGHEREDIIGARKEFIRQWYEFVPRMRVWTGDDLTISEPLPPGTRPVVAWPHDESTYYAHDRRESRWVKVGESATPYKKGDGPSCMAARFVSADHGYGCSPDGKETSNIVFKAGAARDGYFDNNDILAQATKHMDLCEKYWPDEEHILIYDNATTHRKRPDHALSARKMPKTTPKEGCNWGVQVVEKGPDGKPIPGPDGKPKKKIIRMGPGYFESGQPQDLYFPAGHPRAGVFKGMAIILAERGYTWAHDLRAECKKFKCPPDVRFCCCRRVLYNEPDFINVKSVLEEHCEKRGFRVLFFPKYHCELNFLEMVWGKSKREYRMYPPSSKVDDLEQNMIRALENVSITDMRK